MITSVIPKLPFIDKKQTLDYYVTKLGFTLSLDFGDYIILNYGQIEIHFFLFKDLVPIKSDFMIYLRVDDIESLYQAYQKNGVAIHPNGKLEDKAWGQREFSLLDPNGTLLTFGQSIAL